MIKIKNIMYEKCGLGRLNKKQTTYPGSSVCDAAAAAATASVSTFST